MKHGNFFAILIAAASLVVLTPQLVCALNLNSGAAGNTAMNPSSNTPAAQHEAAQMVYGQVHLVKALDARKAQAGQQFETVVDGTIHLKDGTELPRGTTLIGQIATDQMHPNGTSRLALRFTQARLKDGKMVPIRAMIAGVAHPAYDEGYMSDNSAPPVWTQSMLQIDEQGALGDVDLHSRIAGANSGVFVTTKKDDVKLAAGSQLSLAIAARG
jgi:hypothetical protein